MIPSTGEKRKLREAEYTVVGLSIRKEQSPLVLHHEGLRRGHTLMNTLCSSAFPSLISSSLLQLSHKPSKCGPAQLRRLASQVDGGRLWETHLRPILIERLPGTQGSLAVQQVCVKLKHPPLWCQIHSLPLLPHRYSPTSAFLWRCSAAIQATSCCFQHLSVCFKSAYSDMCENIFYLTRCLIVQSNAVLTERASFGLLLFGIIIILLLLCTLAQC